MNDCTVLRLYPEKVACKMALAGCGKSLEIDMDSFVQKRTVASTDMSTCLFHVY